MTAIVIGIGNEFRHDDGVGPAVVKKLAELGPPDVSLAVTDGEPSRLVDLWSEADVAVLVDAVRNDPVHPGKVHELIVDRPVGGLAGTASSHGLGLGEAIDLAVALERMPRRLVILAVEGADFTVGTGLTPEVAAVIDRIVQLAIREVTAPHAA
ncbi:MAG TPA: hydrogenase maturation protease [Jiangellaceae bacterium]|nr:hydrogenase maturation protease [Jiangellaceae bacterium]